MKKHPLPFALLILTALLLFAAWQRVRAAVDLAYFGAAPQGNIAILVEWETATEYDNAGFLLARTTNPGAAYEDYTNISPFIPAEGSDVIGASYEFLDENVEVGITYYYLLKAIETNQSIEYHGPVSATIFIGGEPTDTPTATAIDTATNTPTLTSTSGHTTPTKTRTPHPATATRTRIPAQTRTPAPSTLTPTPYTHTPTIAVSLALTPTATLIPPPAIVLTFPPTETPTPQIKAMTIPSATPTLQTARVFNRGLPVTLGLICLAVISWGALAAGGFILLTRKRG